MNVDPVCQAGDDHRGTNVEDRLSHIPPEVLTSGCPPDSRLIIVSIKYYNKVRPIRFEVFKVSIMIYFK